MKKRKWGRNDKETRKEEWDRDYEGRRKNRK
jgi:hypothetical protein